MDEVENPDLPAAGESSPTMRAVEEEDDPAVDIRPGIKSEDLPDELEDLDPAVDDASGTSLPVSSARPPLKRDYSAPPPQQPPPAPPVPSADSSWSSQDPPDSLTLADLKRIRNTFPNVHDGQKHQLLENEKVYDFDYQDSQSFPVELEEWFTYSEEEESKLRRCKAAFAGEWKASAEGTRDWLDVTEDARRAFVKRWIVVLQRGSDEAAVTKAIMILTYVGLGIWEETAGRQEGCALEDLFIDSSSGGSRLEAYKYSSLQVQWIVAMIDTLHACEGLKAIYDTLQRICERELGSTPPDLPFRNEPQARRGDECMEIWGCLTLLYLFVEVSRTTVNGVALKGDVLALEPSLLNYLTQIVARLRWDEHAPIPLTKMLLLAWKTILVAFGGIQDIEQAKASVQDKREEMDDRGYPIITASPLDYHLFRQEISSKYPAYQAPAPYFPLEPENNSILPPLKHRRPSFVAVENVFTGAPSVGTGSIMHQSVHIATPAPSPPPSPAGPGKAGKKQNYQTNQMFPFLYPPLDARSNDLGGKGSTEVQDALVGRRWEGADIPTSILEAAELFAKRMRATRALQQLWKARVDFMKQERGWKADGDDESLADLDLDTLDLDPQAQKPSSTGHTSLPEPTTPEQRVLGKVNDYYRDSLPHLQSVVIVLLKAVLQNVTDLVTKGNGQNGLQAGIHFNDANVVNGNKPHENGVGPRTGDSVENTTEELDKLRSQEIAVKALSAILLLLLKWFKLSHILQYEYVTQLLLDSNYVPLVLKLWQTQDIGRACHHKLDREDRDFFYFCQSNSRHGMPHFAGSNPGRSDPSNNSTTNNAHSNLPRPSSTDPNLPHPDSDPDSDDAAPPPIKLRRPDDAASSSAIASSSQSATSSTSSLDFATHAPEIDELGYPLTPLPSTPLKTYSWRNVFSSINYLRILQKVTRRKTHRALLLVSYKSSNHLKKTLRIPIHPLRFYTLKLFKSQVPFCGRKWRQSNMKIITAVWLSVPAELRDDWLSGGGGGMGGQCVGDVDGTVEDALPLEQSLRALTHWWNVRNFPAVMGVDTGLRNHEADYFAAELEKMEGWRAAAVAAAAADDDLGEEQALGDESWQGPIEGY